METGCYTALITPFEDDRVDYDGLNALIDFQTANGITGIVAVGTTGESPTLTWDEHNQVIETVVKQTRGKCKCIAGVGSNNTRESLSATEHASHVGADAVLLVDPYYNGPEFFGDSQRICSTHCPGLSGPGYYPICHSRKNRDSTAAGRFGNAVP